jgi:hypothetical protein
MGITGAELADPRVSRTLESVVGRAHCGMTARFAACESG